MVLTSYAPEVRKALNGVFCVYKPAGITMHRLRTMLLLNICRDLNALEVRPPQPFVSIEGDTSKQLSVIVRENYADNVLVVGPRYQPEDFRLNWATYLGKNTSGVCIIGINNGTSKAYHLHNCRPTRTYHVKGILGKLSENHFIDGKVIAKANFKHVRRAGVDRILSAIQAINQRTMLEASGMNINSEAAYQLALQGPIRPSLGALPVLYGLKCIHFEPPDFTLEMLSVNENESYLMSLVHEIGLKLKTAAMCTGLQCIRHSFFTTENALLRKHWKIQDIVKSISYCQEIYKENEDIVQQKVAALKEPATAQHRS